MGKLSEYFTFEELTGTGQALDTNGDKIPTNKEALEANRKEAKIFEKSLARVAQELLDPIRENFDLSITINSGFRGRTLNEAVGGSSTSQHCLGEAADFNVRGYESRAGQIDIIRWILKSGIKFRQLLLERGCIHISLPHGDHKDGEVAEYNVKTKTKSQIKELSV